MSKPFSVTAMVLNRNVDLHEAAQSLTYLHIDLDFSGNYFNLLKWKFVCTLCFSRVLSAYVLFRKWV